MSASTRRLFAEKIAPKIERERSKRLAHRICVAVNQLRHPATTPWARAAAEKYFRDVVFDTTGHRVVKRAGRFVPR